MRSFRSVGVYLRMVCLLVKIVLRHGVIGVAASDDCTVNISVDVETCIVWRQVCLQLTRRNALRGQAQIVKPEKGIKPYKNPGAP